MNVKNALYFVTVYGTPVVLFHYIALPTVPGWTRAPAAEEAQAGGRGVEGAEGGQNHGGHRLHLRGLLAALLHYVGFIHSFETKFHFHKYKGE